MRTLKLENYRGFEEYELRKLAKVNLLVGPNNCGKTSVLEAVQLLVSGGDPNVLISTSRRRREFGNGTGSASSKRRVYPVRHHFHGHAFGLGTSLAISSDSNGERVRMQIVVPEAKEHLALFESYGDGDPGFALKISGSVIGSGIHFPVTEDGLVDWGSRAAWLVSRSMSPRAFSPTQFVTAESLHAREMAGIWNEVELQGRELEVVETMRILHEDLDSIRFLAGDGMGHAGTSPAIVLGFQAGTPRLPIGSFGDGTRRLLALSLSLVRAAGGYLLVDEIDTGLHWSIVEDMWKLVIETALNSSIQVFATTHSLDCVLGLASLLNACPRFRDAVAIQKIERGIDRSVDFDGEAIVTGVDLGVELR